MNALVAAAWVISQVPLTLSSITVRKPFGRDRLGRAQELAAGVVDQRRRAARGARARRRRARSTASSSRMSIGSASAVPPAASTSRPSPASGSGRRPQPITVAPSRASSSAVAWPSPVPAPETTQTWPSSRPGAKIREALGPPSRRASIYPGSPLPAGDEGAAPRPNAADRPAPGGARGGDRHRRAADRGRDVSAPRAFFERADGRFAHAADARRRHPALALVAGARSPPSSIHHPTAGPFLVDTGLHPSVALEAGREPRPRWSRASASPSSSRARTCPRSCARAGSTPKSIRLVVMTHLHFDHASAMSEFPGATFVLTRGRVGGGDHRLAAVPARLPARALRLRLRLPHRQLRLASGSLLLELRPHLRPLRRRQRPARLDPGPHAPATSR